jgi:hypothetical protein
MSEFSDAQIQKMNETSEEGNILRDFCRHAGYKIYIKRLEKIISDDKNIWLRGTEEDARNARFEARGIQRALDELKRIILSGDNANRLLAEIAKEDLPDPVQQERTS